MLVAQMVVWSLLTAAAVFNKQFNWFRQKEISWNGPSLTEMENNL